MRPDFIIAGIMKSGTTFLDGLVRNHPSIRMPIRNMDYSFFDDDRIYSKGISWYESLFDEFINEKNVIIGQTSADCAFNKGSIERIKQHIPDVKLIFVLRHPIERTHSLYWHQYSMGREYRSFEEALKREPGIIQKDYYHYKMYSYVERSRYKSQFDNVYSQFEHKNVCLIPFTSLIKNTLPTLNKIFSFLGVEELESLDQLGHQSVSRNKARIPKNRSVVVLSAFLQKIGLTAVGRRLVNLNKVEGRPPEMNKETRHLLENILAEDIQFYDQLESRFRNLVL